MKTAPDLNHSFPARLRRRWLLALLAVIAFALSAQSVQGGGKRDHEQAQQALESGQILPLRTVLEKLEREHPGKVLEVELERDDGIWIYEIKLLQTDGQLVKLKLDANTAVVLKRKSR